MEEIGRALEIARAATGVEPEAEGLAFRVRRLDGTGEYYLVVFDGEAVAAVDVDRGEALSWARTEGAHLPVDESEARRLAGADVAAEAELVWRSSAESRSPLYPIWAVRRGNTTVYVDQALLSRWLRFRITLNAVGEIENLRGHLVSMFERVASAAFRTRLGL